MKKVRCILAITLIIHMSSTMSSLAQQPTEKESYVDFDIYPPEALVNKGVVYVGDYSCLKNTKFNSYTFDDNGAIVGILKYDGYAELIRIEDVIHCGEDPLNRPSGKKSTPISFPEVLKARIDGAYYVISTATNDEQFLSLRVRKADFDSLGFTYIPLDKVIEICKANLYWAKSRIGTPVEMHATGDITDPRIKYKPAEYEQRILRESPSLSSPFVIIKTPDQGHMFKILSKNSYWFELEMTVHFKFAPGMVGISLYEAGPFHGYWQAPYDPNEYPFVLVDMVNYSWKEIAAIASTSSANN